MRIAIIGSGGREHALAWKIKKDRPESLLYLLPGNGGTSELAHNVPLSDLSPTTILEWAREHSPDLVIIGPEGPLSEGVVDLLEQEGFSTFGPRRDAARIESSKVWAKDFMRRHAIPTAFAELCESYEKAHRWIEEQPFPLVIKVDGLAAGKGVYVCRTRAEAESALNEIFIEKKFGKAGENVVIEEFLDGKEISYLTFVDGESIVPLRPSCDYKPVFDGNTGPNTGGMGVYTPPGFVTKEDLRYIQHSIAEATLSGFKKDGIDFRGVLYIGLMMTKKGPKVLEYNARFGDPETEVLLPLLQSDLLSILQACREGTLHKTPLKWSDRASCGVIIASGGYPGPYERGKVISGLDMVTDSVVFHAGTKKQERETVTDGGRVLCVVATGNSLKEARDMVYHDSAKIHFEGMHYRKDIALREIEKS